MKGNKINLFRNILGVLIIVALCFVFSSSVLADPVSIPSAGSLGLTQAVIDLPPMDDSYCTIPGHDCSIVYLNNGYSRSNGGVIFVDENFSYEIEINGPPDAIVDMWSSNNGGSFTENPHYVTLNSSGYAKIPDDATGSPCHSHGVYDYSCQPINSDTTKEYYFEFNFEVGGIPSTATSGSIYHTWDVTLPTVTIDQSTTDDFFDADGTPNFSGNMNDGARGIGFEFVITGNTTAWGFFKDNTISKNFSDSSHAYDVAGNSFIQLQDWSGFQGTDYAWDFPTYNLSDMPNESSHVCGHSYTWTFKTTDFTLFHNVPAQTPMAAGSASKTFTYTCPVVSASSNFSCGTSTYNSNQLTFNKSAYRSDSQWAMMRIGQGGYSTKWFDLGGGAWTTNPSPTSYTDTNLKAGTTYTYQLSLQYPDGAGGYQTASNVQINCTTAAVPAPTSVTCDESHSYDITLNWSQVTPTYTVERWQPSSEIWSTQSYTGSHLDPGPFAPLTNTEHWIYALSHYDTAWGGSATESGYSWSDHTVKTCQTADCISNNEIVTMDATPSSGTCTNGSHSIEVESYDNCGRHSSANSLPDAPVDYQFWSSGVQVEPSSGWDQVYDNGNISINGSVSGEGYYTLEMRDSEHHTNTDQAGPYPIDMTNADSDSITYSNPRVNVDVAGDNQQTITVHYQEPPSNPYSCGIKNYKLRGHNVENLMISNITERFYEFNAVSSGNPGGTGRACGGAGPFNVYSSEGTGVNYISCNEQGPGNKSTSNFAATVSFDGNIGVTSHTVYDYLDVNDQAGNNNVIRPERGSYIINHSPAISINTPTDNGTYNIGDSIPFNVTVTDPESDPITTEGWVVNCTGTGNAVTTPSARIEDVLITEDMAPNQCTAHYCAVDQYLQADEYTNCSADLAFTINANPQIQSISYSPNGPELTHFGSDGDYEFKVRYYDGDGVTDLSVMRFIINDFAGGELTGHHVSFYLNEQSGMLSSTYNNGGVVDWQSMCDLKGNDCITPIVSPRGEWTLVSATYEVAPTWAEVTYVLNFTPEMWNEGGTPSLNAYAFARDDNNAVSTWKNYETMYTPLLFPDMDTLAPEYDTTIMTETATPDCAYVNDTDQIGYTRDICGINLTTSVVERGTNNTVGSFELYIRNKNTPESYHYSYNTRTSTGTFTYEGTPTQSLFFPGNVTIDSNPPNASFTTEIQGFTSGDNDVFDIFVTATDGAGNGTTHLGNKMTF